MVEIYRTSPEMLPRLSEVMAKAAIAVTGRSPAARCATAAGRRCGADDGRARLRLTGFEWRYAIRPAGGFYPPDPPGYFRQDEGVGAWPRPGCRDAASGEPVDQRPRRVRARRPEAAVDRFAQPLRDLGQRRGVVGLDEVAGLVVFEKGGVDQVEMVVFTAPVVAAKANR